jgi:enoyl-[acyl-carrier protein] reductase II
LAPVRLIKNEFYQQVEDAEKRGASADELKALLGRGRAKKGMFEGDMKEGELEIGQCASLIDNIEAVHVIFKRLLDGYNLAYNRLYASSVF